MIYRCSDKKGVKTKDSLSLSWPFRLKINFPKRLRTMFRGINLCGAEVNTKLPEQHRTHLYYNILFCFYLAVKSANLPLMSLGKRRRGPKGQPGVEALVGALFSPVRTAGTAAGGAYRSLPVGCVLPSAACACTWLFLSLCTTTLFCAELHGDSTAMRPLAYVSTVHAPCNQLVYSL